MNKLTLVVLLFSASLVYADAAESFGTGFANGLQNAIQAQHNQPPQEPYVPVIVPQYRTYWTQVDDSGQVFSGQYFTKSSCVQYLNTVWVDCILMKERVQ